MSAAATEEDDDLISKIASQCEDQFADLVSTHVESKDVAIDLFVEYQQRFAGWTAYQRVFTQGSQRFSERLQDVPDLLEQTLRLLNILRVNLVQIVKSRPVQFHQRQADEGPGTTLERRVWPGLAQLEALEATLTRLDRLSITITQWKQHTLIPWTQSTPGIKPFQDLCRNALQSLFPNASQELRDWLCESMVYRYAIVSQLKTYSTSEIQVAASGKLSAVQQWRSAAAANWVAIQKDLYSGTQSIPPTSRHAAGFAPAQSMPKTINIMNQSGYPPPPALDYSNNITQCGWCSQPFPSQELDESTWRDHVDHDFKPYICPVDKCERSPFFSAYEDWLQHVRSHGKSWYRAIPKPSSWMCAICDEDENIVSNPHTLLVHMRKTHSDQFSDEQLKILSRHSEVQEPRPDDECPFCCFSVDRTKARNNMEKPLEEVRKDGQGAEAEQEVAIARHIASHLHSLMLLSIRLMLLHHNYTDVEAEGDSDIVTMITSDRDQEIHNLGFSNKIIDEESNETETRELVVQSADSSVQFDTSEIEITWDNIPRPKQPAFKEDQFLQQLIRFGAFQSHNEKKRAKTPEKQIEKRSNSPIMIDLSEPPLYESVLGASNPRYSHLPSSQNPNFTGREDTMVRLRHHVFEKKTKICAIYGVEGIGKSELAFEFGHWVERNKPKYSIFVMSFLDLVETTRGSRSGEKMPPLNLREALERFFGHVVVGKWLLLVHGVEEEEPILTVSSFLQHSLRDGKGRIIFTTRRRRLAKLLAGEDCFRLEAWEPQEALDFLERRLGRRIHETQLKVQFEDTSYIPLFVETMARHINANQPVYQLGDAILNAASALWNNYFDQIQRSQPGAARLLLFIALVEPNVIPLTMLPTNLSGPINTAILTLLDYGFLNRRLEVPKTDEADQSPRYSLHRLLHRAIQRWSAKQPDFQEMRIETVKHLAHIFPKDDDVNRTKWQEYLPHALKILEHCEPSLSRHSASLHLWIGRCLVREHRFSEAVDHLSKCVKQRESLFLEDHPRRLGASHELARAYHLSGQNTDALGILESIVDVQKGRYPREHPDLLASLHELASVHQDLGQSQTAIEILESVVTLRMESLPEEHHDLLASMHELARAYLDTDQTRDAIELWEKVVDLKIKKGLSEDNPSRLTSEHSLGVAYLTDGQFDKALAMIDHVVSRRAECLPGDHVSLRYSREILSELKKVEKGKGRATD